MSLKSLQCNVEGNSSSAWYWFQHRRQPAPLKMRKKSNDYVIRDHDDDLLELIIGILYFQTNPYRWMANGCGGQHRESKRSTMPLSLANATAVHRLFKGNNSTRSLGNGSEMPELIIILPINTSHPQTWNDQSKQPNSLLPLPLHLPHLTVLSSQLQWLLVTSSCHLQVLCNWTLELLHPPYLGI